jgi:hypothetical protein
MGTATMGPNGMTCPIGVAKTGSGRPLASTLL